jgi:hypothetical protein
MYPPPGEKNMGNFIVWDANAGKIVQSKPEKFSSGAACSRLRVELPAMARWKAI